MKICVLGHTGFVGSIVYEALQNVEGYNVIGINSRNYVDDNCFDLVVNCAGFSRKYLANKEPDKMKQMESFIFEKISHLKFESLIHISSIEAELQTDLYGVFKNHMEKCLLLKFRNATILRLGGLIGKGLKKNVVFDLIHDKPLFVTADSMYNYILVSEVANIILYLIKYPLGGIINIGASKSISVLEIAKLLKKHVVYGNNKEVYDININKVNSFFPVQSSEYYINTFYYGVI